jgi:hypothetical protein
MQTQQITFEQILPVWQNKLWPNRVSKIETHSAMTWPSSHPNQPYDMNVFNYPVYFFGIYDQDKLVAVNSGHLTTLTEFRSRGLWVDSDYRGKKLAQQKYNDTQKLRYCARHGHRLVVIPYYDYEILTLDYIFEKAGI